MNIYAKIDNNGNSDCSRVVCERISTGSYKCKVGFDFDDKTCFAVSVRVNKIRSVHLNNRTNVIEYSVVDNRENDVDCDVTLSVIKYNNK